MDWHVVEHAIAQARNEQFEVLRARSVGGGSINDAYIIEDDTQRFFVKVNSARFADMFMAEAEGLAELGSANAIRVPEPICFDTQGQTTFIVLEYIEMVHGKNDSAIRLGQDLAALHCKTGSQFGWYRDNTIGSTPQINTRAANWVDFYRQHRLEFQLQLAADNGYSGDLQKLGNRLCENLECFFYNYDPAPSLLHGDLWSGNYSYDTEGNPIIFDPAVYYGDREADIAMTELFGGFPAEFYRSYNEVYALDDGYSIRKVLYNLYHVLNHLNLFGGGYQQQAIGMMHRLLSEI